jgi:hypothetical protein
MACLCEIDKSLVSGAAAARRFLYHRRSVPPKVHRIIPFICAWLATFLIFAHVAMANFSSLMATVHAAGLILSGWVVYRLFQVTDLWKWDENDYRTEMARLAQVCHGLQDLRTASVVVLTSTSINIFMIRLMGLMTFEFVLNFAALLTWAMALVALLYMLSAEPPPPSIGDAELTPQMT